LLQAPITGVALSATLRTIAEDIGILACVRNFVVLRYQVSMIARRSRIHRTRTGKRIEITSRDIEIFRALARYRYLRSTYLYAFAGGASETRFKERLGDLFHEGFIDRPGPQWRFAHARHMPVVYEIGAHAKRILAEYAGGEEPARTFLSEAVHRQFAHSVMICECLASIEIATREVRGLRFIPWPEILARAPESTRDSAIPFRIGVSSGAIIPDGLFGLEYQSEGKKTYRFFALEVDRSTMPVERSNRNQTSYLAKLGMYRQIIVGHVHKAHLGISTLFVLTVTTQETRLAEIARGFERGGRGPEFLFKSVAEQSLIKPIPRLLGEPWQRAGVPPLNIAESD